MAAGLASNDDDDTVMRLGGRDMQKVIPVARQENAAALVGEPQNSFVR